MQNLIPLPQPSEAASPTRRSSQTTLILLRLVGLRCGLALALFFAFTPLQVGAGTVTVDGTGTRPLLLAISGPPVPVGDRVMVGYFAGLTDSQIEVDQTNPAFLDSTFMPFGAGGTVGEGTAVPPVTGRFIFSTTATVEPPSPTFIEPSSPNNQQIYIWAFDSSSSPVDAHRQAIFTSTLPNWTWPTTDDGSTDTSISLDDSVTMLVGGADSQAVFMAVIPEPAPWALLGVGILGALAAERVGVSACRRSGLSA
jgi:hypothetical protein